MQANWWFYYQVEGGEEFWHEALADHRSTVIAEKNPKFVTVLDLNALVTPETTKEEQTAIRYRGPLYFDWDAAGDLELALTKFRQFLAKLVELGVDLKSVRLYATGGRGFHAELPMDLFMSKVPKAGVPLLPLVYKEMCYDLYTDTMDLRVYSTRKGRMWRTPGVQRENGKYKVPLTVDEALNMSADDYDVICSAPRAAPPYAEPMFNMQLGAMFAKAETKVQSAMKRRTNSARDAMLLAKFKGEYPPSLLKVMQGGETSDVGFHQLAMQIAITSNALGKTEEQMLALAGPLCETHQSDGYRYNNPTKRRNELSRMYRYTQDNVCYTYNKDAVRKLVPAGTPTPDLDGLDESAGAVVSGESPLLGGVFMTETGVFKRDPEKEPQQISDLSFRDPMILSDAVSHDVLGYETEVLVGGRSAGHKIVDLSTFLSRAHFQKFAMRYVGGMKGTDNDVVSVSMILRDMAMSNGGMRYLVSREGLDLIQRPGESVPVMDLLWVSPNGVETNSPVFYKYRGSPTEKGIFFSDLLAAPQLKGTEEEAAVIEALFSINVPFVLANTLGWMVSAFHRQVYHYLFNQFPLLSLFGQAGCGKSSLSELLIYMHYYLQRPLIKMASDGTLWGISASAISSASIPLVLDEYKPREMQNNRHHFLKNLLRGSYNAATYSKGGMGTDLGSTWRDVRTFSYSAPIMFIGEALESEAAIQERTIAVPLQKSYLDGRKLPYQLVRDHRAVLSSLGRDIARATFGLDFEQFREQFRKNETEAFSLIAKRNNDRPVFNLAVIMTGLDFLGEVLKARFGDRFTEKVHGLKAALSDTSMHVATTVMPEAARALNALALMSTTEDSMTEFGLRYGEDYVFFGPDKKLLDIKVRNVFVKLKGWSKRKGVPDYYDNEVAFMNGLANFAPLRNKACLDSPLKSPKGMEKVFRFDVNALAEEGVEAFKDGSGS